MLEPSLAAFFRDLRKWLLDDDMDDAWCWNVRQRDERGIE